MFSLNAPNYQKLLDTVPGPSPWYFRPNVTLCSTKFGNVHWKHGEEGTPSSGKILLETDQGQVLAIIDFCHYIQFLEKTLFLDWYQPYPPNPLTFPVEISLYDCNKMKPLSHTTSTFSRMKSKGKNFLSNGGIIASVNIPTTQLERSSITFPDPIKHIPELFMLAESSAVLSSKSKTCIILVHPTEGYYEIFPQDWFNMGNYDFGYQWITRVTRDPETKRIIGDGIRLGSFMLDESMRNLDQWIEKRP
jgi:hypothetical protein